MLSKLSTNIGNKLGLYSKQQCIDIATNIGKELVDLSCSGAELTKDVFQNTIKKHGKKVNVENIITSKSELQELLTSVGYTKEEVHNLTNGSAASTFKLGRNGETVNGIYIPRITKPEDISAFAHEVEHYIYDNNTPMMKALEKLCDFIEFISNKFKIKSDESLSHIYLQKNIQDKLRDMFGIRELTLQEGKFKGIEPTQEGLSQLLASEDFIGLTNNTRINAYLRTILRSEVNPKSRPKILDMLMLKNCLDDEARAYRVSDNINRYLSKSSYTSHEGLITNIYQRASNLLKTEIWYAIKNKIICKPKINETGMPTKAYIGKDPQAANFSCCEKTISEEELPEWAKKAFGLID